MSWITSNLTEFLTDSLSGAIELLGEFFNNIFYWIVDLATQNVYVINAQKFIVSITLSLVGLMVVKNVMSGYLLETDYDSEADPFNLLVKVAETIAIITNAGWIFDFLMSMSKDFTNDLINSANTSGFADQTNTLISIADAAIMGGKLLMWNIMLLVVLITTIIFTVVAGLRGAELVAMKLFFPFFALDLLSNSRERWNNYFTAYVIAFFTYSFQILFFTIALKCYSAVTVTRINYMIATIVWLIIAIKTPSFLEKYLYKSGVSNAASSGLRMVVQTAAWRGMMKG